MLFGGGIASLVVLGLIAFCVLDIIRTEDSSIRNLPKLPWVMLVIFLPVIGCVAWLLLGKPETPAFSRGTGPELTGPVFRRASRPTGPEDSPGFMAALEEKKRLEKWEQELREREEKLRRAQEEGESNKGEQPA